MKNKVFSLVAIVSSLACFSAMAGQGVIGPVNLDYVSAISDVASHKPANLEIGISGGFSVPSGVSCNNQYITTLASAPNYDSMFQLLVAAHINNRQVFLGITDDASKNAFSGRCSLTLVNLQ